MYIFIKGSGRCVKNLTVNTELNEHTNSSWNLMTLVQTLCKLISKKDTTTQNNYNRDCYEYLPFYMQCIYITYHLCTVCTQHFPVNFFHASYLVLYAVDESSACFVIFNVILNKFWTSSLSFSLFNAWFYN